MSLGTALGLMQTHARPYPKGQLSILGQKGVVKEFPALQLNIHSFQGMLVKSLNEYSHMATLGQGHSSIIPIGMGGECPDHSIFIPGLTVYLQVQLNSS